MRKSHDTWVLFSVVFLWVFCFFFFLNTAVQCSGKRKLTEPDTSRFLLVINAKVQSAMEWLCPSQQALLTTGNIYCMFTKMVWGKRSDFCNRLDSLKEERHWLLTEKYLSHGSTVASAWLMTEWTDGCTSTWWLK